MQKGKKHYVVNKRVNNSYQRLGHEDVGAQKDALREKAQRRQESSSPSRIRVWRAPGVDPRA